MRRPEDALPKNAASNLFSADASANEFPFLQHQLPHFGHAHYREAQSGAQPEKFISSLHLAVLCKDFAQYVRAVQTGNRQEVENALGVPGSALEPERMANQCREMPRYIEV